MIAIADTGLDALTDDLVRQLALFCGEIPCRALRSSDAVPDSGVSLHLLGAEPSITLHNTFAAPLALNVRYLITVSAPDVATTHRAYGDLLFGIMGLPAVVLVPGDAAQTALARFGLPPIPALVVEAKLTRSRKHTPAPPVRERKLILSDLNAPAPGAKENT